MTEEVNPEEPLVDMDLLKGITDLVKNRTMFFLPFFGAYMAFLFAKSEYLRDANAVILIVVGSLFLASVRYISLATELLWAVESARMFFAFTKAGLMNPDTKEKDIAAFKALVPILPKLMGAEYWWFRKIMFLFYLATFMVLVDIYIGKWLNAHILRLVGPYLQMAYDRLFT